MCSNRFNFGLLHFNGFYCYLLNVVVCVRDSRVKPTARRSEDLKRIARPFLVTPKILKLKAPYNFGLQLKAIYKTYVI